MRKGHSTTESQAMMRAPLGRTEDGCLPIPEGMPHRTERVASTCMTDPFVISNNHRKIIICKYRTRAKSRSIDSNSSVWIITLSLSLSLPFQNCLMYNMENKKALNVGHFQMRVSGLHLFIISPYFIYIFYHKVHKHVHFNIVIYSGLQTRVLNTYSHHHLLSGNS